MTINHSLMLPSTRTPSACCRNCLDSIRTSPARHSRPFGFEPPPGQPPTIPHSPQHHPFILAFKCCPCTSHPLVHAFVSSRTQTNTTQTYFNALSSTNTPCLNNIYQPSPSNAARAPLTLPTYATHPCLPVPPFTVCHSSVTDYKQTLICN
jgi:hypothetical protein